MHIKISRIIDISTILLCVLFINPLFSISSKSFVVLGILLWFSIALLIDKKAVLSVRGNQCVIWAFLFLLVNIANVIIRNCTFNLHNVLLLVVLMMANYYRNADTDRIEFVIKCCLLYYGLIVLYSIWALHENSYIARYLASSNPEIIRMYGGPLIATYSHVYSVLMGFAIAFGQYQFTKDKRLLIVVVVLFVFLVEAQYTAALLLTVITVFLETIIVGKRTILKLLFSVFALAILIIGILNIQEITNFVVSLMPANMMTKRLKQFADIISMSGIHGDAAYRQSLYQMSFNAFLSNPLFGIGNYDYSFMNLIGGHSSFIDKFGAYGIAGGVPYVMVFIMQFKKDLLNFDNYYKWVYLCLWAVIFFLAILNTVEHITIYFSVFFICPLILKLCNKEFQIDSAVAYSRLYKIKK